MRTTADGAAVKCGPPPGGPEAEHNAGVLDLYEGDLPELWRIRSIVSAVGLVLGVASCLTAYNWPATLWLKAANSVIWTLGPPLWLIVEYCLLVPRWGNPRNKADLQYGQGLASKFRLGVASLLVVIYKG